MTFQGEENDGINIVLIGGALFIFSVICGIGYAIYRLYRPSKPTEEPSISPGSPSDQKGKRIR